MENRKIRGLQLLCLLLLFCSCKEQQVKQTYVVPAPEDVVMYQVNPRVFAAESSFDAVGRQLDSIKQLGVNVVWFMPVNEVGRERSVNSPYCVKDYKAVNPEFGTIDDFKRLVQQCHAKGMSVIIDWVPNHTSWDNAWIANKDWYTQDENGNIISPPNTGWLDVADLNFDNQEMRLAMIDAMRFWINETGIDGFRCDAVDFVPFDFLKQAVDSLRAMPRPLLLLAEGKRKDHFDAGFDINYAWDFLEAVRDVFLKDSSAVEILAVNRAEYDTIPEGKVKLRFTTNHDETMKMSPVQEFGSERASMAAYVATVYLHGGALIYGSQEVGYPERIDFFRYVPVDWSSNNALRKEYEGLMKLYNEYPAIRKGSLAEYPDKDALVFEKYDDTGHFLVLVNVRNSQQEVTLPDAWKNKMVMEAISKKTIKAESTFALAPYQYKIIKR